MFLTKSLISTSIVRRPNSILICHTVSTLQRVPRVTLISPCLPFSSINPSIFTHFLKSNNLKSVLLDFLLSRISGSPLRRVGSNSRTSAILARTPLPSPSASSLFNELESPDDEEPLLPDLCLQILWTEDTKKPSTSSAVKAFVAVDWLGKSCVCWLLDDEKILRCIDLKVTVRKNNILY